MGWANKKGYARSARRRMNILMAVRKLTRPGLGVPHPGSPEHMKDPAFVAKMAKGPLLLMNVSPGTTMSMGKPLALWFVYTLVVSFFAAYITSRAVAPGTSYLSVFRFIGTTAFMAYALGQIPESIWYRRSWTRTFISIFDSLIYALLTAGVFGWLWPG